MHANKSRPYDVRVNEVVCTSMCFANNEMKDNSGECEAAECKECDDMRVNACFVIYEKDEDFGRIQLCETTALDHEVVLLPSQCIDAGASDHLTIQEQAEFSELLNEFPDCFTETPGFCDCIQHEIIVSSDFKPKWLKTYHVPEKLKPEVDKQIQELLNLGLIKESKSPMASPLICVIKKDQSVR